MNSKVRFSNRVDNYVKYRPTYPTEAIDFILKEFNINSETIIADIGSGTGIFTQLLTNYPAMIYAVEPNNEMRNAAEIILNNEKSFTSINGSSESTNLDSNSIDLVTVAQAFHWFDIPKTKIEFKRILKQDGKVLLIWNNRLTNTDFLNEYDSILKQHANDYNEVNHRNVSTDTLKSFFANEIVKIKTFQNVQKFDFEGLMGRLLSSSYSPMPGENNYLIIKTKLEELFKIHNINGFIDFNYETGLYWGSI
jgi:ubiquinone/menaquinone biosynthesis C-methylase UbiE